MTAKTGLAEVVVSHNMRLRTLYIGCAELDTEETIRSHVATFWPSVTVLAVVFIWDWSSAPTARDNNQSPGKPQRRES